MDDAAWAGLDRADQERMLGRAAGLPSDAAAMAIAEGDLEYAVELLEQGRGVLLARQLDAPGQSAALLERAPDLAEELRQVRSALDLAAADGPPAAETPAGGAPAGGTPARRDGWPSPRSRRMELARRHDELVAQIRSRADLRDIVAAPAFARLAAAADHGPVVMINVSQYRCDALIVADGAAQLLPLPGVRAGDLAEQAEALMRAADNAERGIDPVLGWIWDRIVSPVLARLEAAAPGGPGAPLPRIWWCPTGIASFLPLHAAGRYLPDGSRLESALDMAVSSYTPTLRMLIQLRERTSEAAPAGPLVVSVPTAAGVADLPGAEVEARDVAARFGDAAHLTGDEATLAAVTQAMGEHPWAHFACHGVQDLLAPHRGRLMLADGPLAIPQIMALRLPSPSLAFLSACETYRGGTVVPDEGVTLATALQLAGYRHVIGTLWQIGIVAPEVVRHFYDQLLARPAGDPPLGADDAAAALRAAVLALLEESPGIPPLHWAPYIHTGP